MTMITIDLSDEQALRLSELAREAGVAPEELLHAGVEAMLAQPKEDLTRAAQYVVRKNAEIYRRLS
ncbi:MAG TPA: DNA-binding protein [Thermoanaerobaculia bacterium]|nr:DNA-binding protein [Thermoanaerobaculia bacterium]